MKQRHLLLSASLAAAALLGACNKDEPDHSSPPPAPTAETPVAEPATGSPPASEMPGEPSHEMDIGATATLAPTAGSAVAGTLSFMTMEGGLHITGQVTGLAPDSVHGFHLHEKGDCSAPDGSSAGGHFNPTAAPHGKADAGEHHAGDMNNISADATGTAPVDMMIMGVELGTGGANDIIGKGVIVHADADDYSTQPTGNAGARLACGVVTAG